MPELRFLAALSFAMLTAAACAPSSDPASSSPNACSTGAPYTSSPPHGPGSANRALPECVPRCGATQKYPGVGGSWFGLESLPSGACTREETCSMGASATRTCPGQPTQACNLSLYECSCAGGTWSCVTVSQGAGVCGACNRDAGDATP